MPVTIEYLYGKRLACVRFEFAEHNTFNVSRISELIAALRESLTCCDVRCVLFASTRDGYFSDGFSLREMLGRVMRDQLAKSASSRIYDVTQAGYLELLNTPVLTSTFVDGICFGAGFEWALCTDLIVVTPRSSFAFKEAQLELVPGLGGLELLAGRTNPQFASQMFLTGQSVSGTDALRRGIADAESGSLALSQQEIFEPLTELSTDQLAATESILAVRRNKRLALEGSSELFNSLLRKRLF